MANTNSKLTHDIKTRVSLVRPTELYLDNYISLHICRLFADI